MDDYTLPTQWPIAPSRGHVYRRLAEPASFGPFHASVQAHSTYNLAMKLSAPPSDAELDELLRTDRSLAVWAVDTAQGGKHVASCVVSTVALDWHTAVIHHGAFNAARHAELLETMSDALFTLRPELPVVWTAIELPEVPGAQEALTSLGFTEVPSDLDEGRRVTYGLFRHIWSAYKGT